MRRAAFRLSIFYFVCAIFAASAPAQSDSPSASAAAPAFARPHAQKPIPLVWKVAAAGVAAVVSLAVLAFALPRWRSGNLFDRQYRFQRGREVALRLGATRSGGCMATIEFRRGSTSEDA